MKYNVLGINKDDGIEVSISKLHLHNNKTIVPYLNFKRDCNFKLNLKTTRHWFRYIKDHIRKPYGDRYYHIIDL